MYEAKLPNPPLGKTHWECWDADARKPIKEYAKIVREFKRKMAELGVAMKPEQ